MDDRLTKPDWIEHGLRTLAGQGPNALKVGAMATALKVSRGSFYWHFSDIADFRAQLLDGWQEQATDQVIQAISAKAGPDRLKQLLQRAFRGASGSERAIRSWAAEDEGVARVVAAVDVRRVAYITGLLVAAGVEGQAAAQRATFMYWAYLGRIIVMDPRHSSMPASALDDIGDLFEA